MKRIIICLLAAVLLIGGTARIKAEAFNKDLDIEENALISSSAFLDGLLYLTIDGGFFSYAPAGQSLKRLAVDDQRTTARSEEELSAAGLPADSYGSFILFAEDHKLYAIDAQAFGFILPVAIENDVITIHDGVSIDMTPLGLTHGDDASINYITQLSCSHGRLYICTINEMNLSLSLLSYDIGKGGAATRYKADSIWRISPYKEGKLLALTADPADIYQVQSARAFNLSVFDPQTGSLEELGDSSLPFSFRGGSLLYDAQRDMVYIKGESEIYERDSWGRTKVTAYLMPAPYSGGSGDGIFLLSENLLLAVHGKSIAIRETDQDQLPASRLTIRGGSMNDAHEKAMKALGGLSVSFTGGESAYDTQTLAQALVSGDDSFDILIINSEYIDTGRLISKGYAADLSGSPLLQDYMAGLYPIMQETGKRDDKLYMIPVDMNAGGLMSYAAKLFEQVEPLQPPETYDEILDMIQAWNDGLGDKYPDLLPMRSDDYRKRMVTLAISMYADAAAARHQEFNYHDPSLQKMLARALSVQTDNIAQRIDWQSPDAQAQSDLIYSKAALIEDYYYLSLEDLNINLRAQAQGISLLAQSGNTEYETGAQLPLRLALHKGEEPAVGIGLTLMAINPRSRNPASAIAYIEEYVKHIDPGKQAMMNPGLNDHIPNPRYEEEAEALEATRLYYETELRKAQSAEKTELEQRYAEHNKYANIRQEEARYSVHQETISYYRDLIKNSFIRTYEQNMALYSFEMTRLQDQLTLGLISLDQFTEQADGKLRLMRLEGQ